MYRTVASSVIAALIATLNVQTATADERAGATVRVQPDSYQRSGFFPSSLDVGDEIYQEAKVYTEQYGSIEILFDDGTNMTVSPNSEVVIDAFVYAPSSSTGQAAVSLLTGALRMVSGRLPSENYEVRTPVATIGVRGTEFVLDTTTEGITKIWVEDGTVLATPVASNTTFEFDAPAYAECSASSCEDQSPGEPPVSFPATPPSQGEENEGPGGGDGGDGGY